MKKSTLFEAIRFVIVGGVSFAVEFVCLWILKDGFGMDTLIATPIAFIISLAVNYLLCLLWVFKGAKKSGAGTAVGFIITSLIGLALNELLMLIFRHLFGEEKILLEIFGYTIRMYLLNKAIATVIVMVWNYFTKRFIMKKK